MTIVTESQLLETCEEWTPPLPPTDLIFDDGEPMESNRHRIAMNLLIDSLECYWEDKKDFFVGGNMFIYYSSRQARNRDFKGPDFFVVLNVEENPSRQGWVVWEEEGRYPDVIIELLSPTTAVEDLGRKKEIYRTTFKTRNYFVYDPFNPASFQGWQLQGDEYQEINPNEQGWLWSNVLELWVGTWTGILSKEEAIWLRFYTPSGQLVLLAKELERLRTQQEQQKAEQERERAEQQTELAQRERERAEQQTELAQQERERAERLAAKLRELGIEPENI